MKRTPLTRKTPLKASKPVNPINSERRKKNHARAYGSSAFLNWIHKLPCWACGYHGPTPRQAAHTTTGGMGRKADANTVIALCPNCHQKQHQSGWAAIGMSKDDARAAAVFTATRWQKVQDE